METESYIRQCPEHGEELASEGVEFSLAMFESGMQSRTTGITVPELACPEGPHLVGVACAVDHWLVVHKPSGLVVADANEDGFRLVDTRVLMVTPDDLAPRRVMIENTATKPDVANWKRRNLHAAWRVAEGS